jgi:hypothetical protein
VLEWKGTEDKGRDVSVFARFDVSMILKAVSSVSVFACVWILPCKLEVSWFPDRKRDASANRCRF